MILVEQSLFDEDLDWIKWNFSLPGDFTSFQISRGSYILEVVHVDDVNDGRNYSGLILQHKEKEKKN